MKKAAFMIERKDENWYRLRHKVWFGWSTVDKSGSLEDCLNYLKWNCEPPRYFDLNGKPL